MQVTLIGAPLAVVGIIVTMVGAYRLGLARAARKWDSIENPPRGGRGVATTLVLTGLLCIGVGAGMLATELRLSGLTPTLKTVVAVGIGVAAFLLAMYLAAKYADHVELNALIRTPARIRRVPASAGQPGTGNGRGTRPDPIVPPTAQPGWVYRDPDGAWYLVVSSGAGHRLVSLPDFRLMPVGRVTSEITVAGSVELAVWPLSDTPGGSDTEVGSPV